LLSNFSDYAADYPKLTFEQVAKKLGEDFKKGQERRSVREGMPGSF
jgi:hypothetical protein